MRSERRVAGWAVLGVLAGLSGGACGSANPNPQLSITASDAAVGDSVVHASGAGSPTERGVPGSMDAGAAPDRGVLGDGAAVSGFADLYATIFLPSCSGGACHNPGSHGAVTVFTEIGAYNTLVKFVTPMNATGSSLYGILASGRMPPGGPRLSASELAAIAAWIDAGALND